MGHQHHGEPEFRAKLAQPTQDVMLDDHIEGGHRFVRQHEAGPEGERHGDRGALPHAAGELVGEGAEAPPIQADEVAQRHRLLPGGRAGQAAGDHQDLVELVAQPVDRVERIHRRLRHHRDLPPAVAGHLALLERGEVGAVEGDPAAGDAGVAGQDPDDGPSQRRLPAPALAHQAQDLAPRDVEGDAVHGVTRSPRRAVLDPQVFDREERHYCRRSRGKSSSSYPRLMK